MHYGDQPASKRSVEMSFGCFADGAQLIAAMRLHQRLSPGECGADEAGDGPR